MIRYNFSFRGPYEYDKFVLNYLQLHNSALFLQIQDARSTREELKELYDSLTSEEALYPTHAKRMAAEMEGAIT